MVENIEKFVDALIAALGDETFVKLTLGNYKGNDEHLQKLLVRLVTTKKGTRLFFLYRYVASDITKNYSLDDGIAIIRTLLRKDFFSGHLFSTESDFQLEIGKKERSRLNVSKPTFKGTISRDHDREKNREIDRSAFFLKPLGITTDNGEIRVKAQDKWRQINKYVEILASLFDKSDLKDRKTVKIADMGSGKGYLTFAAYDYFRRRKGLEVEMTGVEARQDMVDLCNGVAAACNFNGLKFVNSSIADFDADGMDILIALHACDTATDDAIYKGIAAKAELIITAPCCHQELRPQMRSPDVLADILKHGVMLERTAETVTDGLRSMLLERSGYSTKLFEFVATEHTPKNNMLVGTRNAKPNDVNIIQKRIDELTAFFGIKEQHLDRLLLDPVHDKHV